MGIPVIITPTALGDLGTHGGDGLMEFMMSSGVSLSATHGAGRQNGFVVSRRFSQKTGKIGTLKRKPELFTFAFQNVFRVTGFNDRFDDFPNIISRVVG